MTLARSFHIYLHAFATFGVAAAGVPTTFLRKGSVPAERRMGRSPRETGARSSPIRTKIV